MAKRFSHQVQPLPLLALVAHLNAHRREGGDPT